MFLTMFLVSVFTFAIAEIAPGNIATNILGVFITPEQESSSNAQHGLDDPPPIRYFRWLVGSDQQAERLIGKPITRITDKNGRVS